MKIQEWPESERPREKFIAKGPSALSDAELLAIFLRTGLPGICAVSLARSLLKSAGGLRQLLRADYKKLKSFKGMGIAKAVQLQATVELCQRFIAQEIMQGLNLSSSQDAKRFLTAKLRDLKHEVFACLFLNSQNSVIAYEMLFQGTIDETHVHPREVVVRALHHNAACVIFAHNHPSGESAPSPADIQITRRLVKALALIDIKVLDHIVIGETATSMADNGLIQAYTY